ncbi:HK97 family phage portal protein [Aneurinibacillus soli]|uniref:Phage portal protein n=1 Tax=Aneurinibacillus soli TaxID=1500254 RepID=A0A0U5BFB8_9BACL|nr:phage portal protein [Aneurinibacillus soli]PYE62974.1 HK97 family phage portal protein [Aneurinibacillus soli]BAU28967.1 Phage portal protein [Aneurinibacillus soli]
MKLPVLSRMFGRFFEKRSEQEAAGGSLSGWMRGQSVEEISANENNSLQLTAVWACVRILSETIASLPLNVYQQMDGGKEKAKDHPLYDVLHNVANEEMTAFKFRETAQLHLSLWGNCYAEVEYDKAGRIRGLWPLLPDRTKPVRAKGKKELYYETTIDGQRISLPRERVLHIPGLGFDGLIGYAPLEMARKSFELGMYAERFGSDFFKNGTNVGAVVTHPGTLNDGSFERLRKSLQEKYEGLGKAHRMMLLEEGMTFAKNMIPPNDAQFLETRKFQISEIARFFRVPPHMLADLDRSTFGNIEHQSIEFVTHTIRPWLVRWEQQMQKDLLSEEDRKKFSISHVIDGLLRGDIKSRYEAYSIGRQNGWLSADDIRELEDMNALPDGQGKVYLVPLNMMPAQYVIDGPDTQGNESGTTSEERSLQAQKVAELRRIRQRRVYELRSRVTKNYRKTLDRAFSRIAEKEAGDVLQKANELFQQRNIDLFNLWLDDYYDDFQVYFEEEMMPVILSLADTIIQGVADELEAEEEISLQPFIAAIVTSMALRYITRSKNRITKVINDGVSNSVGLVEVIEKETTRWKEKRPEQEAKRQSVRTANAVAKAAYKKHGVRELVWVTSSGEVCDFCKRLDGKIIGIDQAFVAEGEDLVGNEDEMPLKPKKNIKHPPLHNGCECGIAANR